ncbi:head-tail connector protein [Inquilinus sp. CA228]|uniref:head-tail connector protein n=1 Tax=Inquilinus sp. CA228 TaxID=3455609 RepID=UPI003F8D3871
MTLILVDAPAVPALRRQEMWDHLPVDYDAGSPLEEPFDAATIDAYIAAAISHVDGDGWLGRALITQTWDYVLDGFPGHGAHACITMPLPPLQEIVSVTYVDGHGALQTLPPSQYRPVGAGSLSPAYLFPAFGKCWPTAPCRHGGLTIRFRAGFGDAPEDVPAAIHQALKLLAAGWYRNRESVITGTIVAEMPFAVKALLQPYRVYL